MAWTVVASESVYTTLQTNHATLRIVFNGGRVFASLDFGSAVVVTSEVTAKSGVNYRARYTGTQDGASINVPTSGSTSNTYTNISGSRGQDFYGTLYLEEEYTPSPPPTPSSITVPTTIKGGESFTVSWGTSSGATRYYLERSVNGVSFTQIYSGSSRSVTETSLTSWNTVAYRVRAYNTDGYSGYRTSPTRTVTHNTAPTTPSSITVPELRSGNTATISWGASTDVDGNTINYYLERSINGGAYSVIRSGGTTRSYDDTILKEWTTVTYRVRAYDGTVYSGYQISSTITVKHFPEFNIKIDGMLKVSENGWVKIDGVLKEIESIWVKVDGVLKEV